MRPLFETVTDLEQGREILAERRYGLIEAAEGQFQRVRLRPYPKLVSASGILVFGSWQHQHRQADFCRLYYNQPLRFPNFLAVTYLVSGRKTTLATIRRALETLDRIAMFKRADALLCDVANWRISREILARWGWQPHCPSRWHRHYIKRFYGVFPLELEHRVKLNEGLAESQASLPLPFQDDQHGAMV
jgi:hypothetical protein